MLNILTSAQNSVMHVTLVIFMCLQQMFVLLASKISIKAELIEDKCSLKLY